VREIIYQDKGTHFGNVEEVFSTARQPFSGPVVSWPQSTHTRRSRSNA
jgi:hypothetical protein